MRSNKKVLQDTRIYTLQINFGLKRVKRYCLGTTESTLLLENMSMTEIETVNKTEQPSSLKHQNEPENSNATVFSDLDGMSVVLAENLEFQKTNDTAGRYLPNYLIITNSCINVIA